MFFSIWKNRYWRRFNIEEILNKIRPRYRSEIKLDKKAKTRQQFVDELLVRNPEVKLIGEYKGANSKTLFECNLGHRFYSYPTYIVKSILTGCKECRKINGGYKQNKTHEQYLKELKDIDSVLVPIEEYKGTHTLIEHMCKIHNIITKTSPSNALKGIGCKKCGKEKISQKQIKSKEEYIEQLKDANPNLTLMGEYLGSDTPTTFSCKCGYVWIGRPQSYILPNAFGCRNCANKRISEKNKIGLIEYKKRLSLMQNNIVLIENFYINNQTPLLHKCLVCTNEWKITPNSVLSGHGCPKCANKLNAQRLKKTHKEFIKDFKINNPSCDHILILSKYTGSHDRIKCKCIICGYNWKPQATDLLCGSGCPMCNASLGERKIARFFDINNIFYKTQQPFDKLIGVGGGNLLYDFYLPQYNLLIEYQGEQHERPIEYFGGVEQFEKQIEHDRRKREYAIEHNIYLLEIWYYDINNIENILKETLDNLKSESLTTAG